jgi:hypothetical protein
MVLILCRFFVTKRSLKFTLQYHFNYVCLYEYFLQCPPYVVYVISVKKVPTDDELVDPESNMQNCSVSLKF